MGPFKASGGHSKQIRFHPTIMVTWKEAKEFLSKHASLAAAVGTAVASFVKFMNYDVRFLRWRSKDSLRRIAAVCGCSPEGYPNNKLPIEGSVIVSKTLKCVLKAYLEHAMSYPRNGFMLVCCSEPGTGKSSCLHAFTNAKFDFLPDRAVYIDLIDDRTGEASAIFAEKLGFAEQCMEKAVTRAHMAVDLLVAVSGEQEDEQFEAVLAGWYRDFYEGLNPISKLGMSIWGRVRSVGNKLTHPPCGSEEDIADDAVDGGHGGDDIDGHDDSKRGSSDLPQVPTVPTEATNPGSSCNPNRCIDVIYPEALKKEDDFFMFTHFDADIVPTGLLCIDNIPESDDEKLMDFFGKLKEILWDHSHRVVVIATTRFPETAEKLRKLNTNQKITLVKGSYVGDPTDKTTPLKYDNFNWTPADMKEHLEIKFSDQLNKGVGLVTSNEIAEILEEAAKKRTVRDAEAEFVLQVNKVGGIKKVLQD